MTEIKPMYDCKRAVLKINSETGHVALWKNPDSFFPTEQIELISVVVEHYPQDHTIGIYGVRITYLHKSDIEKDRALFDKICSKFIGTEKTQNIIRWMMRMPPRRRKYLIERSKESGNWYMAKELRDFRLTIREDRLSIFEGINPGLGNLNK